MKGFQKLALASAIAALPVSGMAMEPLNDSEMSGVTGQDGINLAIDLDVEADAYWEDTSGTTSPAGADNPAAVEVADLALGGTVDIDINAGTLDTATDDAVLNIGIDFGADPVTIGDGTTGISVGVGAVGDIPAGEERSAEDGIARVTGANYTEVMSIDQISIEGLALDIQLGPDADTFITISTATPFDITSENFTIMDEASGGVAGENDLTVEELLVQNIDLDGTTIGIEDEGLVMSLASGTGNTNVAMMGVEFGNGGVIGNAYLTGIDLGGTSVTVSAP